MTAVDHIICQHDLIFKNQFFKIYYIYSEERLLNKLKGTYEQISQINSPLSESLCIKILGDATTMAEVERNVINYCNNEPNNFFQRIKNYYYYNPEIIFLNGISFFGIIILCISMQPSFYPS